MAFGLRDKQRIAWLLLISFSLSVVIYLTLSTSAFATGWMYISSAHKPSQEKWGSYESPHGNFSSNSNKCRVCHALHKANGDSYRLLFDNSRQTSCDRCHDPVTGLSGKKPYRLTSKAQKIQQHRNYSRVDSGANPENPKLISTQKRVRIPAPRPVENAKGEHTRGATYIPESSIDAPPSFTPDGLSCYSCHDPHFVPENIIQTIARWKSKGLLKDPGENGGSADAGLISVQPYDENTKPITEATSNPSEGEVKSAFCGDCHNENPNWSGSDDVRPNKRSHPINTDAFVEAYGPQKRVSISNINSCMSCHLATNETNDQGQYLGPSSFPHQSVGHKLLDDNYDTPSTVAGYDYTGDPKRSLPNLDAGVCRNGQCHTGVGVTTSKESY